LNLKPETGLENHFQRLLISYASPTATATATATTKTRHGGARQQQPRTCLNYNYNNPRNPTQGKVANKPRQKGRCDKRRPQWFSRHETLKTQLPYGVCQHLKGIYKGNNQDKGNGNGNDYRQQTKKQQAAEAW
jgi:hypothetical protein